MMPAVLPVKTAGPAAGHLPPLVVQASAGSQRMQLRWPECRLQSKAFLWAVRGATHQQGVAERMTAAAVAAPVMPRVTAAHVSDSRELCEAGGYLTVQPTVIHGSMCAHWPLHICSGKPSLQHVWDSKSD